MTHKLLQLGHDVQKRRRAVGGLTTGSGVECLSCVAWYTSTTQLNSTELDVELCRYKRGLTDRNEPIFPMTFWSHVGRRDTSE